MDLCSPHFGKTIDKLTYADIEGYFKDERSETDQIEFKSFSATLAKGLDKIVLSTCAFLNSKGGIIIWGAPQKAPDKETYSGPLVPLTETLDIDRLISIISDRITALPRGIRPRFIEGPSKQYVCVIEIQESDYSPHRVSKEHQYYMRIEAQTRIAPHHYVEALFRKIRYPNIEGYIKIVHAKHVKHNSVIRFDIAIQVQIHNWSPLQNAEEVFFRLSLDRANLPDRSINFVSDPARVVHYGMPHSRHIHINTDTELTQYHNYQFEIELMFGAKNSPAKVSMYTVSLDAILKVTSDSYNAALVDAQENVMFKDLQDKLGKNREAILMDTLGRVPNS